MNEKRKKKTNKFKLGLFFLLLIIFSFSSLYLIYNILLLKGIENIIRLCAVGFITLLLLIFFFLGFRTVHKGKAKSIAIYLFFIILVSAVEFTGAYYINKAYSSISNMNKSQVTYGTSLVVMDKSKFNKVSDLKSKKIGIIKDTSSVEGYIISQDIIKENSINKNNLVKYDDFLSMLNDLYEGNVDAIFVSSSYVSMFGNIDQFENIKTETKILTSKTKTMAKKETNTTTNNSSQGQAITKPFTMLIMGIDSTADDIRSATSFNGDSLILITFNPKTLNATMMSIPRDTFVPIMCFKNHIQNKITHAAWYGESCMMSTITNFTGINIDYYVKIDFKGVVKLVDAVGGITVDVPYNLCEQNSSRAWGKSTVYIKKGIQALNGEQALALSRNRHKPNDGSDVGSTMAKYCSTYNEGIRNDFVRGQNQQLVIKALVDKLKTIRNVNKLYEILDLIQKSMDTNLTTDQILSFYNIGKQILVNSKDGTILNFDQLYLSTYGAMIYDESTKLQLSDQIYYKGSLKEDVDAMEVNLGIKKTTVVKTFSFSINKIYEPQIIGKGNYNEAAVALVPNFAKYTKATATSWGIKNDVNITFKTVDSSSSAYSDGQITNQSVPASSLVSIAKTKGIVLTIINKTNSTTSERIDCDDSTNKSNSVCVIKNYVGSSKSSIDTWISKITASATIQTKAITTDDETKDNKIASQDEDLIGKSLYDLKDKTIIFEYYKYVKPDSSDELPEALRP